MAKITLVVGSITVERTFADAAATSVLERVYSATYVPQEGDPASPTAKQRLQYVLERTVDWLVGTARDYRQRELRAANEAAERAEVGTISL